MNRKQRIVFFTRFTADDEVSRNRFYADEPVWNQQDFEVVHCPLYGAAASEAWHKKGVEPNGFPALFAKLRRWFHLLLYKKNTIAVAEYPLLPEASFSFQKEWLEKQQKAVIDITHFEAKQDAVFTGLIRLADAVVTTTPAVTRQLLPLAKDLVQIPLSVSVKKYDRLQPAQQPAEEKTPFRIGWLGNKNTSPRLLSLKDCFLQLHDLYNIQLVLIGFDKTKEPELKGLPFINHSRNGNSDIALLKSCDAGVLPLPDGYSDFPFEMIQYMACSLPVVAASCEAAIAVGHGNDNLFVRNSFEWYSCLAAAIQNKAFYREAGEKNKAIVNDFYSSDKTQKDYLSLLLNIPNR